MMARFGQGSRGDEDFLQRQAIRSAGLRAAARGVASSNCWAVAVGQNFQFAARLGAHCKRAAKIELRGRLRKRHPDLLKPLARVVRRQRQQLAALLDDGEFVNQPLELGDQVRRNKDRPVLGIARRGRRR